MTTAFGVGRQMVFSDAHAEPGSARAVSSCTVSSCAGGNLRPLAPAALGDWLDLLSRISHDLRTPLNAVIGFSDAMQHELFGPLGHTRYQEYVRHIRASGDELLRAAEDTLAMTSVLAAPETIVLDDVRLAEPLRAEMMANEREATAQGVVIDCDIDPDATVQADPRILPRALKQLVAAALSRADSGSRLVLSTSRGDGRIRLTVEVTADRDGGVTKGAREPLTARDELPLRLARMLIELQDGTLTSETVPGRHSIVVTLLEAPPPDRSARRS